jgi:predicted nucleotidyltransferase
MKTREQIIRLLESEKADLYARFPVRSLALFGSYARGDERPDSDVDILVEVSPDIGLEFVALADHIERLLGTHVDLVSRRAVKARHWKHIERDLIYV